MRLATPQFKENALGCVTIFKYFIWEAYHRHKTKFPTVYPTIYFQKRKFEYSDLLSDCISFLVCSMGI